MFVVSAKDATRVLIIEGRALLAKALVQIISEDQGLCVAGSSPKVDQAAIIAAAPQLIILDADDSIAMLGELVTGCKNAAPDARVCVLSEYLNPDVLLRALSAGADAFVMKDIPPTEMLASIKAVAGGSFYADPRLSGAVLRQRAQRRDRDISELSPREIEVVRLIAQGLSNKEISQRLLLSDKTVKNHISSIFSKLHMTARTQVAIHAIRTGFV
ncbi:MAG TPA: response regulator transcription factor [Candidatus Baltobacteraceae bacterium]|jgi:DNA-binding NarL/FixJ family response regulator